MGGAASGFHGTPRHGTKSGALVGGLGTTVPGEYGGAKRGSKVRSRPRGHVHRRRGPLCPNGAHGYGEIGGKRGGGGDWGDHPEHVEVGSGLDGGSTAANFAATASGAGRGNGDRVPRVGVLEPIHCAGWRRSRRRARWTQSRGSGASV